MVIGSLGKGITLLLVLLEYILGVFDPLRRQDVDPIGQRDRIMESKECSLEETLEKKLRSSVISGQRSMIQFRNKNKAACQLVS